jgi:hypothetical protein
MSPALTALPLVALIVVIVIACICERYIRRHPRNRYKPTVRRPWPRQGHDETRGYFATSERPGPECAGKVG